MYPIAKIVSQTDDFAIQAQRCFTIVASARNGIEQILQAIPQNRDNHFQDGETPTAIAYSTQSADIQRLVRENAGYFNKQIVERKVSVYQIFFDFLTGHAYVRNAYVVDKTLAFYLDNNGSKHLTTVDFLS